MGVDLTLCPERFHYPQLSWLASVRLPLDLRDYDLWDTLREIATPVDGIVEWYGDEGIEELTEDCYGKPLAFVTAHQLSRLMPNDEMTPWDTAVMAFVRALPPTTRVLLYFH